MSSHHAHFAAIRQFSQQSAAGHRIAGQSVQMATVSHVVAGNTGSRALNPGQGPKPPSAQVKRLTNNVSSQAAKIKELEKQNKALEKSLKSTKTDKKELEKKVDKLAKVVEKVADKQKSKPVKTVAAHGRIAEVVMYCAAVTASGQPCSRKAKPGSSLCGVHDKGQQVVVPKTDASCLGYAQPGPSHGFGGYGGYGFGM